ncbi:MAG TPA: M13 family metallopeptidase [Bryobacteraceae bacterium]|nr:M13 family metallopeptidase [Bryobacteraceae bacterium]
MKQTAVLVALLLCAGGLSAQSSANETALKSLPYSPSLDVNAMDRSVDPCTDFYRYSCGGWIKSNPIPPDQERWDVYAKLTEDNLRFLWGLLEEASKPSAERSAVEAQIGDYFYACMDEAAVEKTGAAPLKPWLDQIAALKSVGDLPALVARLHLDGGTMMFDFGSSQDYEDSSRVIAFANAGGLGLPDRDYYVKTDAKSQETRQKYLEHVQNMLELLGEPADKAKADAQTVMDIETALAKASFTRVELRDPRKLFHRMPIAQLQAMTPSFKWDAYLREAKVPDVSVVNVTEPAFYKELQALLKSRPLADWQTYLRWHLAHSYAPYLSSPFVNANFDFYSKHLRGLEQLPPRWKRCVRQVDRDLGEALGQVFVAKTFSADTKARAQLMTKQVEDAMENEIKQLPWMSEATKQRALEKLHAVVNKIGYPDKWRDYSSVKIARDDYFGNLLRAMEFESRRQLDKIGKPVDRKEWLMTPPTVNAYYDPQMNDINFPAGVLQPPLYDPKMDDAPNYGDTGATIGHELTHGFDDEGRQFDAKGNLKNWWTKSDARSFEKAAKCVSDEYSGFTIVDNIKINGKLTLGEDLADLGGTWLAYLAWKEATKGQNLQPADGLTPDQRFFVGMAQWACGDERAESKRLGAITNPHSPLEYRVNGVVSNMPEFGKAFSCRIGQPMVRVNQCKVW